MFTSVSSCISKQNPLHVYVCNTVNCLFNIIIINVTLLKKMHDLLLNFTNFQKTDVYPLLTNKLLLFFDISPHTFKITNGTQLYHNKHIHNIILHCYIR